MMEEVNDSCWTVIYILVLEREISVATLQWLDWAVVPAVRYFEIMLASTHYC